MFYLNSNLTWNSHPENKVKKACIVYEQCHQIMARIRDLSQTKQGSGEIHFRSLNLNIKWDVMSACVV